MHFPFTLKILTMIFILITQLHSIGAHIGSPVALSLRFEQDFRILAGWNLLENNVYFSFDKDFNIPTRELQPLKFYIGIGGYLMTVKVNKNQSAGVGIRVPFTLNYSFTEAPIDLGIQITPAFRLIPNTTLDFFAGLLLMLRL